MTCEQSPQSFLNTRAGWMLGELSLPQLLEIPRRPEVLDEVPDFGLDEPALIRLNSGKANAVRPVDILRGARFEAGKRHDPARLERGLRGALNVILNHSVTTMGLNLDASRVSFRILCESARQQWEYFPYMHLDSPDPGDTLYVYTVASQASSLFLDESITLPEGFGFGGIDAIDAFDSLTMNKRRFQPPPSRVVLFDETVPHSVPPPQLNRWAANDLRTLMRIWISSPLPTSRQSPGA